MIFAIIAAVLLLILFVLYACSEELTVTSYVISTDKVIDSVKILQVSDLHNALYGKDQCVLISEIDRIDPDVIVMTGDIADPRDDKEENAFSLCRMLAEKYSCYYVIGNHENAYPGRVSKICARFAETGVIPLRGNGEKLKIGDSDILIAGVDDPLASPDYNLRMWENQLNDCCEMIEKDVFSVLLSHRPECVNDYKATDFDLILAGHAHGGQVRIPKICEQGLYAPHQGWFPKYTSGRFELKEGQTLIVSRGLSKFVRPRVFNRPELVLITVEPK